MELRSLDADHIYGDSFTRTAEGVTNIGNNVSLVFERMDFGSCENAVLALHGSTPLKANPITVRVQNEAGDEVTEVADFQNGAQRQTFTVPVLPGVCTVTFEFLPGSQFDFYGFAFSKEN